MENTVPVVQISNLDFRFDSALPLVLKDVTMSIARGRYESFKVQGPLFTLSYCIDAA